MFDARLLPTVRCLLSSVDSTTDLQYGIGFNLNSRLQKYSVQSVSKLQNMVPSRVWYLIQNGIIIVETVPSVYSWKNG